MTIIEEKEAEAVTFVAKWFVWIIVAVVVIVLICGWLWWNSHESAKNAAAVPKAAAIQNAAQATAGGAAINAVQTNADKGKATDDKTRSIVNNYNTYPAAKIAVDPALFDAFKHGICMYKSAASLPECVGLQQSDPK